MPDELSPLLQLVQANRAALAQREAIVTNRLITAYKSLYQRLQGLIDALVLQIGQDMPTAGQLVRIERYRELLKQTAEELTGFQAITRAEIEQLARTGITLGANDARGLLSTTVTGSTGIAARFNALPRDAIESLLGFLDPQGPLYERLRMLAPTVTDEVSRVLLDGLGAGFNPRKVAREITNTLGMGLTDAMRMTRTVNLYSYREASRATYIANSDVVEGWIWHAELGPRTCLSCIAQHGTVHSLDEALKDHYNGHCTEVPIVRGFPALATPGDGEKWFNSLSEAEQRKMMGAHKHSAWKDGRFNFDKLSTWREDPVYGKMRQEASLKELLGGR